MCCITGKQTNKQILTVEFRIPIFCPPKFPESKTEREREREREQMITEI